MKACWLCPSCGAPPNGHGKGGSAACLGRTSTCLGFVCDCWGEKAVSASDDSDHGTESNVCTFSRCSHCGWEGQWPREGRVVTESVVEERTNQRYRLLTSIGLRLGVAVSFADAVSSNISGSTPSYDGEVIAGRWTSGERRGLGDIAHEIAHFVVCPQKRRKLPEFGLGDAFGVVPPPPAVVSESFAYVEENRATVVTALIAILLPRYAWQDVAVFDDVAGSRLAFAWAANYKAAELQKVGVQRRHFKRVLAEIGRSMRRV